jgi:hypothetical protein
MIAQTLALESMFRRRNHLDSLALKGVAINQLASPMRCADDRYLRTLLESASLIGRSERLSSKRRDGQRINTRESIA